MERRRARRALPLALGIGAAILLGPGCGDSTQTPGAPPAVVESTRSFVDPSRPTPANGSYPGASTRTLDTRIWAAAAAPRGAPSCSRAGCGLLVLAHGYGGSTARFEAIGQFLAQAGYLVAAPSFPLTNEDAPGGHLTFTALADVAQQPGDVSFLIGRLLAASGDPADELHGRIDPARVGVLGHSLGGATVLGATRTGCCTDPRIGAVVAVAPAWTVLEAYLHEKPGPDGPPTLIVNGSADTTVVPALSIQLFELLSPPRVYVEVPGAHHSDLIENVGPPGPFLDPTERAAAAFFDAELAGRGAELDDTLRMLAADGETVRTD
jgi:predicted dienelactone hydrolase